MLGVKACKGERQQPRDAQLSLQGATVEGKVAGKDGKPSPGEICGTYTHSSGSSEIT